MRKGKIAYNSLIRAVLRAPFPQREKAELSADSAFLGEGRIRSSVNTTVYGGEHAAALSFYRSLNSLLSGGAEPESVQLSLTLPVGMTEPATAELMRDYQALSEKEGLRIAGGHTMYAESVSKQVLTITVSGPAVSDRKKPEPGDALLMTGYAGAAGTLVIAESERELLLRRFRESFLPGPGRWELLSAVPAARILRAYGAVLHDISEGGVFGALYEFAEGYGCGFTAEPERIPLLQETVEIAEYLKEPAVNPYTLLSTGCLLAAVPDGAAALQALHSSGIAAEIIGSVTAGRQKILLRNGEERFLDRPEQDGLFRFSAFG